MDIIKGPPQSQWWAQNSNLIPLFLSATYVAHSQLRYKIPYLFRNRMTAIQHINRSRHVIEVKLIRPVWFTVASAFFISRFLAVLVSFFQFCNPIIKWSNGKPIFFKTFLTNFWTHLSFSFITKIRMISLEFCTFFECSFCCLWSLTIIYYILNVEKPTLKIST